MQPKNLFAVVFITGALGFGSLAACGKGGEAAPGSSAATAGIGPAGGTVRSPDGALTIDIPAGALAAVTPIEIQPIANNAPGGQGAAFRLLPSDTTFAVPVKLRFQLAPADLAGTTLDAIGVGFQGADGRWRAVDAVARDTTSVSVTTSHFSDWSRLVGWQIRPAEAHVKSGDHATLRVIDCEPTEDDGVTSLLAACTADDILSALVSGWAVNGVPGGNMGVGLLQSSGDVADYLAPIVVGEETFAVSVQLTPRRAHPNVTLVSNITVGSDQSFLVVGTFDQQSTAYFACGLAPSTWMKDGFRLTVSRNSDDTWSTGDIQNQPTTYAPPQPISPVISVQMDAEPVLFDLTSATAGAFQGTSLVSVTLTGTQEPGACTVKLGDGTSLPFPSSGPVPMSYVVTFDPAHPSLPPGPPGSGWSFEVTEQH